MGLNRLCTTIIFLEALLSFAHGQQNVPVTEFSDVVIPEFPLHTKFANEPISLDRLDLYERFDRELTTLCYMHSSTSLALKRANRYFPILEPILKEEGIPVDFLYMAVIESTLNPRAVSPAKAVGLWQIMARTGREYGLEVNDDIDERYHVEKATRAACRYLKDAYKKYGNWATVAASYNAGMGRISTELEKQIADHTFDLWLNEETSRYVFRILAMKEIFSSPAKYGYKLKTKQLYQPIEYTLIKVDTTITDLAQFAQSQGISYAQLKEANPWLRSRTMPDKSRKVYYIKRVRSIGDEPAKEKPAKKDVVNKFEPIDDDNLPF